MQLFVYLTALCLCFIPEGAQGIDEPLSKQSWSQFGPLSKHYILGRKEKPDAVYVILKHHGYYFVIRGRARYQPSKKPDRLKENIDRIMEEFGVIKLRKKVPSISDVLEEQGFKIIVDATVPYVQYYTKQEFLHHVQS